MEAIGYLFSILLANAMVQVFGIVTIFGLSFPAGAVAIGLSFSLRDSVQRRYGKWACWFWMIIGCAITTAMNVELALASAVAFIASEAVDWLVYTLMHSKSFRIRVVVSNLFSIPIDSALFVWMAFGWLLPVMIGQAIVKMLSGLIVVVFRK